MGAESTKTGYLVSKYSMESEVREWEMKLGTFEKSCMQIMSKINTKLLVYDCENIPKTNLINFFNLEFKENAFNNIINNEIFKTSSQTESRYDPDMIKILFFLLTVSQTSPDKSNKYQDKAKLLCSFVKDDNEELNSPLHRENPVFAEFIETCVYISTITLVEAFLIENPSTRIEKDLKNLKNFQKEIVEEILNELFSNTQGSALTFKLLNEIMEKNPFCLTSGYIRTFGYIEADKPKKEAITEKGDNVKASKNTDEEKNIEINNQITNE